MKLILFPLALMLVLGLLSGMGLGSEGALQSTYYTTVSGAEVTNGFYDERGHQVAYANGTFYGEEGEIAYAPIQGGAGVWTQTPFWHNNSGYYNIYSTPAAAAANRVAKINTNEWTLESSFGFIALVVAICTFGGIIGFRFLGSGENETSTKLIIVGGFLLILWSVLSVIGLPLIMLVPFGGMFYIILTLIYSVGVVQNATGGD